jgi:acylphosphatase
MFRDFTRHQAQALGVTGFVRNLPGGQGVEVVAEGQREKLEQLLDVVRRGPPRAVVEGISTTWGERTGEFEDFKIRY